MTLATAAHAIVSRARKNSKVKPHGDSESGPQVNPADHITLLFPDALPDFGDRLTPILDSLVSEYVQAMPREKMIDLDTTTFVDWLAGNETISDSQRELFVAMFAEPGVTRISMAKRLIHARFEELTAVPVQYKQHLLQPKAVIYLNPNHVWAITSCKPRDVEESFPREEVLFYQVAGKVRRVVVEPELIPLFKELADEPMLARTFLRELDSCNHADWCDILLRLLEQKVLAVT